jgi:hypothetical protein
MVYRAQELGLAAKAQVLCCRGNMLRVGIARRLGKYYEREWLGLSDKIEKQE